MDDEQHDLYARLAAPFDKVYTREQAGQSFKYITGEQCISRLNEECGIGGHSFKVVEHGIHAEADEAWCLVELTVIDGDTPSTAYGFGSQKIKRRRDTGVPLNLGQDMKGAMTDALKVAAKHFGVALYLYDKDDTSDQGGYPAPSNTGGGYNGGGSSSYSAPPPSNTGGGFTGSQGDDLTCEECGEPLTETRFKDGTAWAPTQLAVFGRRKHSRILCMTHYREANQAKRRAEEALQQVPF